jgi:hypothetical protein
VIWIFGYLDIWIFGYLDIWIFGYFRQQSDRLYEVMLVDGKKPTIAIEHQSRYIISVQQDAPLSLTIQHLIYSILNNALACTPDDSSTPFGSEL